MIFRTEKTRDGQWQWHLWSTKMRVDIAHCACPVSTETECVERIKMLKLGVPEAIIRLSSEGNPGTQTL